MKGKMLCRCIPTLVALLMVSWAQAALVPVLGGQAVYDTDLNITWLADANAGAGSIFDDGFSTTDGRMFWANANAWAASLTVGGVMGWRLPTTTQPDPSCSSQFDPGGGMPLQGSGLGCTGSEMGHLFNVEGVSAGAQGLFSNVQSTSYWSGTQYAPTPTDAWAFSFMTGNQGTTSKVFSLGSAWAVHDGKVIPIPPSVWLFASALGLLGWLKRHQAE